MSATVCCGAGLAGESGESEMGVHLDGNQCLATNVYNVLVPSICCIFNKLIVIQ